MRLFCTITILFATVCFPTAISQEKQALFVKKDIVESGKRVARQTSADQMVQNILQWLQGVYTQNSRTIRQGTLREYLPPINAQKPRPFEPPTQSNHIGNGDNNFINGYPPSGITPQPPFSDGIIYPSIRPQIIPPVYYIPGGFTGYPTSSKPQPSFPTSTGSYPSPTGSYPSPTGSYPSPTGSTGSPSTGFPTAPGPLDFRARLPEFPNTPTSGTTTTGFPTPTVVFPSTTSSLPTTTTSFSRANTDFSVIEAGSPSPSTTPSSSFTTSYPRPYPTNPPTTQAPGTTTYSPTSETETQPPFTSELQTTTPEDNFVPTEFPSDTETPTDGNTDVPETTTTVLNVRLGADDDEDDALRHPPHIHAINVECSKEMMTINIEFNRQFDGIIYSKGHYNSPECRYVKENTARTKYSFTVSLNSCGTQFRNAFDTEGRSYLENVLVLQNEPGIQEVWDTIRAVRCLWEGNLKKALNVALSVGMLNQEIVTFSGDTAMARLDIQLGKGPFAPPVNGLVKIGEVMTLVVSVTGDPGFDIQVKDCRAKDSNGGNIVGLTDDRGCILKPKLFGAFQKTRNTGNTGASIIAYAFFNAFKFPDVMDLILECNVDLCKTDCEMCPEPNQKVEPGRRRRRDLYSQNVTGEESVTMGKMLRVILPEDLNDGQTTINFTQNEGICMSTQGFVLSSAILISLLTSSCLFSAYMWLKYQRLYFKK
ncbi:hypothetical protein ILUMI_26486 [Ignelater luminosus]|uniref:ZP domain-containing protein n=1 Tax=Ignelater luminosus TaxID=2038154 RepID=A0A8K0C3R2_IGNLU|nr:hypothetical protein ILUMI_26486 [Ignelater luminosus]